MYLTLRFYINFFSQKTEQGHKQLGNGRVAQWGAVLTQMFIKTLIFFSTSVLYFTLTLPVCMKIPPMPQK